MRLDDEAESQNVEDRRGSGGFSIGGGSIGIGTIIVALAASYFFGINPMTIINGAQVLHGNAPQRQAAPSDAPPANDPAPKLVLFSGGTQTACGMGQAAMGPFYCPADRKVYIDLSFYRELRDRFGAGGDFAQAYVIAHEVGHHVQNVLGISDKVDQARARMSREQANALSVRVELQADCFAGVWAAVAQRDNAKLIEPGDFEQGLNAAGAIGDDRLQQETQGRVVPEAFTHGTSAQRQRWLRRGMSTGDVKQCDTFSAQGL
jgi:predicted metalloprotease